MARASRGVRRFALAGAGLAAFLAAAHLAGRTQGDDTLVAPTARAQRAAPQPATRAEAARAAPAPASAALSAGRGDAVREDTGQPFAATSWLPPPPPPPRPVVVVAAPPAAPVAPPLPFTFVGLVEKGTVKPQAFLARGDELLVVSQGDVLDNGAYRVEALSPSQIVFIHVPTNTKQIISLSGGAS